MKEKNKEKNLRRRAYESEFEEIQNELDYISGSDFEKYNALRDRRDKIYAKVLWEDPEYIDVLLCRGGAHTDSRIVCGFQRGRSISFSHWWDVLFHPIAFFWWNVYNLKKKIKWWRMTSEQRFIEQKKKDETADLDMTIFYISIRKKAPEQKKFEYLLKY